MDKEPCTTFCGALISSHEVIRLQGFESSLTDVIPANVQNISALSFFAHFCYNFIEKEPFTQFYGRFDDRL